MAVGDLFQLNVVGKVHGQTTVNTFYYRIKVQAAGDPRQKLIDCWIAGCHTDYVACLSSEWTTDHFEAAGLQPVLPKVDFFDATPGAVAGVCLPSSVAAVMRRKTLTPGRTGRGRVYLPAIPNSFEDDSKIAVAAQPTYTALGLSLGLDIVDAGWTFTPQHVRRKPALQGLDIDRWTLDSIMRNQRRRQVGVGI